MTIFGVPTQALFGQLLIGLINGAFYALLSLGLSVIFGLLNIINFTHGAQYMMGAFVAYFLLQWVGLGYWWALLIAPVVVGITGIALERATLKRLYHLDHLYGLLLTFGFALIIQGLFRHEYGSSGLPYAMPRELAGGRNLGFMFLPNYRAWVIVFSLVVCLTTWYVIERTRLGSYLRAATENPALVQAFGINVPRMITLTYGFGVGLAALAGVLAAPIYQVNPLMGADLIIVVFAVVVIGGLGSIMCSIVTGFGLGIEDLREALHHPEAEAGGARAHDRAESADHDHGEDDDDEVGAHERVHLIDRRRQHARQRREADAEPVGQRDHPGHVDPERLHECRVFGRGAQVRAEARALDHVPGREADREREHDDPGPVVGQEHEAEILATGELARHRIG